MDAPQHAVITAERAALAFADEPTFVEEARFMRDLSTNTDSDSHKWRIRITDMT